MQSRDFLIWRHSQRFKFNGQSPHGLLVRGDDSSAGKVFSYVDPYTYSANRSSSN